MSTLNLGAVVLVMGCTAAHQPGPPSQEAPPPAMGPGIPDASSAPALHAPQARSASEAPPPWNPDGEVCHGSIDEALQQQLAGRAAQVRFCYERLLKRDPQREGRLTVTVKLSGEGNIDHAAITLDELYDRETSQCALGSFKDPLSGKISADCAIVNVPLRFLRKKPMPPSESVPPAAP